jgi:hypothetical protein
MNAIATGVTAKTARTLGSPGTKRRYCGRLRNSSRDRLCAFRSSTMRVARPDSDRPAQLIQILRLTSDCDRDFIVQLNVAGLLRRRIRGKEQNQIVMHIIDGRRLRKTIGANSG